MPDPDGTAAEFLAKVAHEIRQPLSPMHAALHLLRECDNTLVRERAYGAIERQIDHMTHEGARDPEWIAPAHLPPLHPG